MPLIIYTRQPGTKLINARKSLYYLIEELPKFFVVMNDYIRKIMQPLVYPQLICIQAKWWHLLQQQCKVLTTDLLYQQFLVSTEEEISFNLALHSCLVVIKDGQSLQAFHEWLHGQLMMFKAHRRLHLTLKKTIQKLVFLHHLNQ